MASATTIGVDQPPLPPTSDGYEGSCLAVPPLDLDIFSREGGADDDLDFDFDLDFSLDDFDELPSPVDSRALPDVDFDRFNAMVESLSSELRGDVEFLGNQNSDFSDNTGVSSGNGQYDLKPRNFSPSGSQGAAKIPNCNLPESNCNSSNSNDDSFSSEVFDHKVKNGADGSLLKRKKNVDGSSNMRHGVNNCRKSNPGDDSNERDEFIEDKERRKIRLMRNRESAQLSRQRKKYYVEELEGKVTKMHSTIQELNARVSQIIAENAALRQQLSGGGVPNPYLPSPPPHVMHPYMGMMYPWIPYVAPPYVVKQGSQVPLWPIPKLKSHKRVKEDSGKNVGKRTKKVAGVSILGFLLFIVLFGALVPMVNVRYGEVREPYSDGGKYNGAMFDEKHHGRVLMVNGSRLNNLSEECLHCAYGHKNENGSLVASLYIPRNNKLVKIDGNLIIHSVLASERATSHRSSVGNGGKGLALPGDLAPAIPVRNDDVNAKKLTDGPLQQWFLEGLAGPMLRSGMCTEVFQFEVSKASTNGAIIPAASMVAMNISEQNSTGISDKRRNRRILRSIPIPLAGSSHNNLSTQRNEGKEKLNGNSSLPPMVVSVLLDPKEMTDAELMGTKSISKVFVVVLIDSIKYVTYSCMLPFKGTVSSHLVN